MDKELTERLKEIESALAHLDRQYEELNGVVIQQGKLLAKLQSHLQRVGRTVEAIELERIQATNPTPPHYQ